MIVFLLTDKPGFTVRKSTNTNEPQNIMPLCFIQSILLLLKVSNAHWQESTTRQIGHRKKKKSQFHIFDVDFGALLRFSFCSLKTSLSHGYISACESSAAQKNIQMSVHQWDKCPWNTQHHIASHHNQKQSHAVVHVILQHLAVSGMSGKIEK